MTAGRSSPISARCNCRNTPPWQRSPKRRRSCHETGTSRRISDLIVVATSLVAVFAVIAPASMKQNRSTRTGRLSAVSALIVAAIAAAALVFSAATWPRSTAAGWLIAFVFLSAIPLGSLLWLLIHRLTGGEWGRALRPAFLWAALLLPIITLLFVPLLFVLSSLYPWVDGAADVKADVADWYLNSAGFIMRAGHRVVRLERACAAGARTDGSAACGHRLDLFTRRDQSDVGRLDSVGTIHSSYRPPFGASVAIAQLLAALAAIAAVRPTGRRQGDAVISAA